MVLLGIEIGSSLHSFASPRFGPTLLRQLPFFEAKGARLLSDKVRRRSRPELYYSAVKCTYLSKRLGESRDGGNLLSGFFFPELII